MPLNDLTCDLKLAGPCPPSAHAPPQVTAMLLHPRPALLQMQLQLQCLRLPAAIASYS